MVPQAAFRALALVPGLFLVGAVTLAAFALQQGLAIWVPRFPIASLTLAVLIGAAVSSAVRLGASTQPGLRFTSRRILRLAILLMGFRLTWSQLASMGPGALAVVVIGSGLTFAATLLLGRALRLPRDRALLLAAGTCVCGAAAIAAVDGSVRAKEEDAAFALAAVTLFGTIALFFDPVLKEVLHLSDRFYAVWVGASVHEVAQVAAAAAPLPADEQTLASTVKLLRVLFILPMTVVLSLLPSRTEGNSTAAGGRVAIPWFALGFFAASALVSFALVPPSWTQPILDLDSVLLTAAMAALGLGIDYRKFLAMERRSVLLGLVPTLLLMVLAAGLTRLLIR